MKLIFRVSENLMLYVSIFMIPYVYFFSIIYILPHFYHYPDFWYLFHLSLSTFILFNAGLNFYYLCTVNTSIKGIYIPASLCETGRFCSICEYYCPPRSYHCHVCKTCILRRDHHCAFSGSCVGQLNHRFYLICLFYTAVAAVYSSYFNVPYTYTLYSHRPGYQMALINVFPLFSLLLRVISIQEFLVSLHCLVCLVSAIALTILGAFHLRLALLGRTVHENAQKSNNSRTWTSLDRHIGNLRAIVGRKYILVWLWPFVESGPTKSDVV